MQEVTRFPDHGKELTLFCKEPQCQTLICSVCLTKRHRKHDIVDADENKKEELLTSLTSAIESLSFKKDQITTVQNAEESKNDDCLQKLTEEKRSTPNMVRNKYNSLIADALKQKGVSSSRRGNEMTLLEENLVLLNNIKQYVDEETLSAGDVKNYQDTVDSITQHTDYALLGPRTYEFIEYTENKDRERLVEELCGQLIRRKHSINEFVQKGGFPGSFPKQSSSSHIERVLPKFEGKFLKPVRLFC